MIKKFYIWEGHYNNFKSALSNKRGKGFYGIDHLKKIQKEYKIINNQICTNKIISKKLTNRLNFLLPVVKKLIKNKKKIKILDFGGGYGLAYFYLQQKLTKDIKKIDYNLIDIRNVTKIINEKKIKIRSLNKVKKSNFDLIFTSSCIQYIANWKTLIRVFCKMKPKNLLFIDLFVGNIRDFVSLQKYYNNKIPQWFINYNSFVSELNKHRYFLKKKSDNQSYRINKKCYLDMTNFKRKYRLKKTLDLLFSR